MLFEAIYVLHRDVVIPQHYFNSQLIGNLNIFRALNNF